ncbi:DUF6232 family protein [Roseomonas gilardii]|nr:DUF6232 family protein [Roseomonas gilardii]
MGYSDEIIYRAGNVVVSKTLVQIDGTTYPVNGIGSVLVRKSDPKTLIFLAVVCAIIGLIGLTDKQGIPGSIISFAIAAGFIYWAKSKPSILILRTASGDQQALKSRDKNLLQSVKLAIEQAVIARG